MLAVVRIRGSVGVSGQLKDTMELMQLHAANHCVVIHETPAMKGMIDKVQSFVTYGPISEATLTRLIEKRGRVSGDKKVDEAFLKQAKIKSVSELAKAIMNGKRPIELGVKNVFRLKPPKKGFERGGIKKPYPLGGALGPRGKDMDALLESMM